MIEYNPSLCNCGDFGHPIDGPYHAHRCKVTQFLLAVTEGGDRYYVSIPEHDIFFRRKDHMATPWPTRELAEGAMHRVLFYANTPILLWRNDTVIDMKSVSCPIQYEWRQKNGRVYDWQTGEKVAA